MKRLSRAEHNERNRGLVLDAARSIFLAQGYHGATVDKIAEQAGFSKGVVYSQFGNKADMFLALLEQSIDERLRDNAERAKQLSGRHDLVALVQQLAERQSADREWGLLLVEFRAHASRDPGLNRRYATAHQRTISGLAAILTGLYEQAGLEPQLPAADLAQLLLALSTGMQLEQAAIPGSLQAPLRDKVLTRIMAAPDGSEHRRFRSSAGPQEGPR
jgi:AcrR family transcriptional regulator